MNRLHALKELAVDDNEIAFFPNPLGRYASCFSLEALAGLISPCSMRSLEMFSYKPNPLDAQYTEIRDLEQLFKCVFFFGVFYCFWSERSVLHLL